MVYISYRKAELVKENGCKAVATPHKRSLFKIKIQHLHNSHEIFTEGTSCENSFMLSDYFPEKKDKTRKRTDSFVSDVR